MSRVRKPIPVLILSILAATSLAHATEVTIQAQVDASVPGVPRSDIQGPATSGQLLATVLMPEAQSLDGLGPAFGRAAQNDAGVGAVAAEVKCTANGTGIATSHTTWTGTATNNSNVMGEFIYQFYIEAPKLALVDPSGTSEAAATATYEVTVKVGGQTIFSSQATLRGGRFGHTLKESGTDLGGVFFGTPGSTPFGYGFAPYQGILSLGFYQPGQSVTVESSLQAVATAVNVTTGARAEVGDPLDLGSEPGIYGTITLGEPLAVEPSSWGAVKEMFRGR